MSTHFRFVKRIQRRLQIIYIRLGTGTACADAIWFTTKFECYHERYWAYHTLLKPPNKYFIHRYFASLWNHSKQLYPPESHRSMLEVHQKYCDRSTTLVILLSFAQFARNELPGFKTWSDTQYRILIMNKRCRAGKLLCPY
jgi:hypothetical protein